MTHNDPHHWAAFGTFDPYQGEVIRRPVSEGPGNWVGAPSVHYDIDTGKYYVVYRIRRPRGQHPDRGAEIRIAESSDGITFDDIWQGIKDTLQSPSIERCALTRGADGNWLFYVSYVDPSDNRWRIDRIEADDPKNIDLVNVKRVFSAADIRAEGIKDPFLFRVGGLLHMIVSYATAPQASSSEQLHATADAYNTGLISSSTGLATSEDGMDWQWEGDILSPSSGGWDRYCSRIGCVWYQAPVWLALYDGSADVSENYEERAGLAFSFDLRRFQRCTRNRPLFSDSPGAVRYFDVLQETHRKLFYYELAQPDGSHDMRVFVAD